MECEFNVQLVVEMVSAFFGIWKLLEPAARVVNLRELSTTKGLWANPHGNHTLYIGVDT